MADGNVISVDTISPVSTTTGTVGENKAPAGPAEGNQDCALSTDGKEVPTGASRNNICSGSLVNNGASAGHGGGNKDCTAPDDDRKDSSRSADGGKVKHQRRSRKVKQKQPVIGRYRWRTSSYHRLIIIITEEHSLRRLNTPSHLSDASKTHWSLPHMQLQVEKQVRMKRRTKKKTSQQSC